MHFNRGLVIRRGREYLRLTGGNGGVAVNEGTGKNAQVEGYAVGGKTATSEKLPRGNGKYISSFLGFAPADDPQIMGLVLIDEPVGVYYGGTIAAPVMAEIFENILPYYLGE